MTYPFGQISPCTPTRRAGLPLAGPRQHHAGVSGREHGPADYLGAGGTLEGLRAAAESVAEIQPAAAESPLPNSPSAAAGPALPVCVFDLTRQRYYVPAGSEWIPLNDTRIATHFKAHSFSECVKDAFGVSVLETALQKIVMQNNVVWSGELAGYWPGPVEVLGRRMLVTRGPKLPTPKAGDWSTLRGILEGMLISDETDGATQWNLLMGWVGSAFQALSDQTFRPGLALAVCGKSNCGKSQLSLLLAKVLGGRIANPYSFLIGRTDFSEELIGAELLTIDDEASERDLKSRQTLGQNIKRLIVGVTQRGHGKGARA